MDNGASNYRRFLEGDEQGLIEIVKMYSDGLVLFINTFVRDLDVSEDIMQDTYVELLIKKNSFKGIDNAKFKTFLYRIARNKSIDFMRKRARIAEHHRIEDFQLTGEVEPPERTLIKDEQKRALLEAIDELRPEYRQALYLAYFEDMNNQEIAAVTGKSVRQVEMISYRAKKSLKHELEKRSIVNGNL